MRFRITPLLLLASYMAQVSALRAQQSSADNAPFGMGMDRKLPAQYEEKAAQLRAAPEQTYDFSKANLGDVLRYLATDSKINFISLDEESGEANKVVTFSITGSPFTVLETLCKAHGLALIPENGMWYIRPADDKELIGKGYLIRYNALERVEKTADTGGGQGGGNGNGSLMAASVDLQGARETFKVLPSELIKDIRLILDLPPDEEGMGAGNNPQAAMMGALAGGQQPGGAGAAPDNQLSANHKPKVLWKSDSNTLYVVATRLQHSWVEGYLEAADKEQAQIAIEVKFVETSHDPSKELGLDWSGTLGQEGTFWQTTGRKWDPTLGQKELVPSGFDAQGKPTGYSIQPSGDWSVEREKVSNTSGGFRTDLASLFNVQDLNEVGKEVFKYPFASVYSNQDISVKLRALLNDSDTKTTSYPRMVVSNNREAVFKSVVNQPVLGSSATVGGSSGSAASSEQITYLPIGTVLNILPKQMQDERVSLNIGITVSSIIGEQVISGNPYPVATSRVYNAPVVVDNGYTVAISGLDEAREKEGQTGVPLLSKIPIIKYAFSSKSRSKNHKNLMIFITPSIIDPKGGGLPKEPESVVPRKPESMMPKKPQIASDGNLQGGPDALPGAIDYLRRECDVIQATINEARQTSVESQKLTDMKKALNALETQAEQMATQYPDKNGILSKALADIEELEGRVSKMKAEIFKKAYY